MRFCPNCGREVGEEAAYCARCGGRLREAGGEGVLSAVDGAIKESRAGTPLPPVEGLQVPVPPPPAAHVEKRRWSYPAAVVAVVLFAAAAVLLTLFLAGGKGMGLQEYKDRAGAIHGEAGESLSELAVEMEEIINSSSGSEDPEEVEEAIEEVDSLLRESLATCLEARSDLQELQPPKGAQSLHRQLLDFYFECESVFWEVGLFLDYSRQLLSAMAGGYAELSRFLSEGIATEEDVNRAVQMLEDYYSSSLEKLEAVEPPGGLEDFHRRFLDVWKELSPAIDDLKVALADRDLVILTSALSSLESWQNDMALLAGELESRFDEVGGKLLDMGEKGADLDDELMAL